VKPFSPLSPSSVFKMEAVDSSDTKLGKDRNIRNI
jgi:hypothetical protein